MNELLMSRISETVKLINEEIERRFGEIYKASGSIEARKALNEYYNGSLVLWRLSRACEHLHETEKELVKEVLNERT